MSVCNNKACLCTCKNSYVSICELDFDQANTATRPDQGCFRPCRFTRIRLCLQTDSFFFSGLAYRLHQVQKHSPEQRGAFENTGLSFSCGRTRENRGDVVVVAFLCGGTKNSSNTPRVNANLKKKWRKNILFQKYWNAYSRDLNVTESLVWRKHKCNSLPQKRSGRKRKHKDKEKNFLFSCTLACDYAFYCLCHRSF